MSKLLSAADFLSPKRFTYEDVELRGGGTVRVRALDVDSRDIFIDLASDIANARQLSRLLALKCCVDAEGERLFTDEQLPRLAAVQAEDIESIAAAAMRVSNLTRKEGTKSDPSGEPEAEDDSPNA